VDGVDLGSMLAVAAIFIKCAGRDLRQQNGPCGLEIDARLIEGECRAASMLSRMQSGIEAATPSPLIDLDGHACTPTDRTNPHVAIVDAPAFAMGIGAAAASEAWHPQ
jgi:hypothetical protein